MTKAIGSFANNDIEHIDPGGADHETFSFGLKKSLLNYMHGIGLDEPLQKWFDPVTMGFKVPKTAVSPDYVANALNEYDTTLEKPTAKIIWLGKHTGTEFYTQSKKGNSREMMSLVFTSKKETQEIKVNRNQGEWLAAILPKLSVANDKIYTFREVKDSL